MPGKWNLLRGIGISLHALVLVFRIPGESTEAVESLPVNWMEEEGGECCVRGRWSGPW